jgi:hypothetical protein
MFAHIFVLMVLATLLVSVSPAGDQILRKLLRNFF